MEDDMIERAARAAYIELAGAQGDADAQRYFEEMEIYGHAAAGRNWDDAASGLQLSPNRDDFRRCARAAIEAMREPTAAMIEVGRDIPGDTPAGTSEEAAAIWQAMIDAALSPSPADPR